MVYYTLFQTIVKSFTARAHDKLSLPIGLIALNKWKILFLSLSALSQVWGCKD